MPRDDDSQQDEVPALLTVVNPRSALGSAGDELSQGIESPGTPFMTWNLLYQARMLKDVGGLPAPAASTPSGTPAAASTPRIPSTADGPASQSEPRTVTFVALVPWRDD